VKKIHGKDFVPASVKKSMKYENPFDPDEPWRDFKRFRRNIMEEEMLEAYKMRSFFQYPFKNFEATPMILMTEELATIYHFPGSVAGTPTLGRIPSKKSEPPTNLPR
jgi:hypothetical protein